MITLQQATTNDIALIHELASNTWFETYREMLSGDQMNYMFDWMYSLESLHNQMTSLNHVFFIAYDQQESLGFVSVEKQQENLYHLHKLYILPAGQGRGIGRILINKAFDFAKEQANGKKCALELNMNRDNKALFFYQKMGMRIHDQGDFHIGNGYYMNDYILRIDFE